jgi:hypothetical protein
MTESHLSRSTFNVPDLILKCLADICFLVVIAIDASDSKRAVEAVNARAERLFRRDTAYRKNRKLSRSPFSKALLTGDIKTAERWISYWLILELKDQRFRFGRQWYKNDLHLNPEVAKLAIHPATHSKGTLPNFFSFYSQLMKRIRNFFFILLLLPLFPQVKWSAFKLLSTYNATPKGHTVDTLYFFRRGPDSLRVHLSGQFVDRIDTIH